MRDGWVTTATKPRKKLRTLQAGFRQFFKTDRKLHFGTNAPVWLS